MIDVYSIEYFLPGRCFYFLLVSAAVASINQMITETRIYRVKSKIAVGVPLGKQLFFGWSVTSHFLSLCVA